MDPSTLHSPNIERRSPESERDRSDKLDRSSEVSILLLNHMIIFTEIQKLNL